MARYLATVDWTRQGPDFVKGQYSREHTLGFDGGITLKASSAVSSVPLPWSNPAYVDPEEAFVAAVSSCHMLTFLWEASRVGFIADSYHDEAVGEMTKNERGVLWMSVITLRPRIAWSGDKQPMKQDIEHLHHVAHEQCYIANSIRTEVRVD